MRVAEFFAGIGLVRLALEPHGFDVVWANDIDQAKLEMYRRNFDPTDFVLDDIREIAGRDLPDVELATASFPCTDLSLAGKRLGLNGSQSSMFWEFARILREMRGRRPSVVLLENVPSFATSNRGEDLRLAVQRLNRLGYWCDLLVINARHFVPQSRPRLFIVGSQRSLPRIEPMDTDAIRPPWIRAFIDGNPSMRFNIAPLELPAAVNASLSSIVERLDPADPRWWDRDRAARFVAELSPIQRTRFESLWANLVTTWATAYRRTRNGKPAWEIRRDAIAGALRTARGGSSKQALVEAGRGEARVRWMTALEYARLQGAPDYDFTGVPENRAMFGFGDAVCVPVVSWLAEAYLVPLLAGKEPTPFPDLPEASDRRELVPSG